MKRVLVTGESSYIGNKLSEHLNRFQNNYVVNKISLRNNYWKTIEFSAYDVIVHVAGIAHRRESGDIIQEFYRINRDLSFEVAKKAKRENVNQFIYLSSMSVYGVTNGNITKETPIIPNTHYGKSKKEAENLLKKLETNSFKVSIVRPPMVYGKNCPGNYKKLRDLVIKIPVFPTFHNERSMIYVENLTEFIRFLIDSGKNGVFHPQNSEFVCTSEMVKEILQVHNKKSIYTPIFNQLIKILIKKSVNINKIFGDLTYDRDLSNGLELYNIYSFKESIEKSECY